MNIFAVFAVHISNNKIWATTRPDGKIGLPGGKVDLGETPIQALIREAKEEGLDMIIPDQDPIHMQLIDNKLVAWYIATNAIPLVDYKEKYRNIYPIQIDIQTLVNNSKGFGNDFLLN